MTEWHVERPVHTIEFHTGRERAPHLEQDDHRARLLKTADIIKGLADEVRAVDWPIGFDIEVSDLGCGDGGLLQLLKDVDVDAWGYDFSPVNEAGWKERGVLAEVWDVFNDPSFALSGFWGQPRLGDIVVMTEVLEHIKDPHGVLAKMYNARVDWNIYYMVASSPRFETADHIGDCHQWAWDWEGYEKLFTDAGWKIKDHVAVDWSQIVVVE